MKNAKQQRDERRQRRSEKTDLVKIREKVKGAFGWVRLSDGVEIDFNGRFFDVYNPQTTDSREGPLEVVFSMETAREHIREKTIMTLSDNLDPSEVNFCLVDDEQQIILSLNTPSEVSWFFSKDDEDDETWMIVDKFGSSPFNSETDDTVFRSRLLAIKERDAIESNCCDLNLPLQVVKTTPPPDVTEDEDELSRDEWDLIVSALLAVCPSGGGSDVHSLVRKINKMRNDVLGNGATIGHLQQVAYNEIRDHLIESDSHFRPTTQLPKWEELDF